MIPLRGVSVDFIDGFNESAKSTYPDEFICLHRVHDGLIDEMVMLPGTIYGDSHSIIFEWMSPVDLEQSGSAHSHPGYSNEASEDDLTMFGHFGGVHFITCQPYDRKSWAAYNSRGERIHLDMLYADGSKAEERIAASRSLRRSPRPARAWSPGTLCPETPRRFSYSGGRRGLRSRYTARSS